VTDALLSSLADAHDGAARLVADVRDQQWDLPTPCGEWTVRHWSTTSSAATG